MAGEDLDNQIIDLIIHSGDQVTEETYRNTLEMLQRMYKLKFIHCSYDE